MKFDRIRHKTFSTQFYVIDSHEKIAILRNKWMEGTNTIIYSRTNTIVIDKIELKWDQIETTKKQKGHQDRQRCTTND